MIKFENPERVDIRETLKKYLDQYILIAGTDLNTKTALLSIVCPLEESPELYEMQQNL